MSTYNPTIAFNRFTKNGVVQDITTSGVTSSGTGLERIGTGTMTGVSEEKAIYPFAITPAEPTTVTPDVCEIVFDIAPNDGDEQKYIMPFSHGGNEAHSVGAISDERFGGMTAGVIDETVWTVGVLSGVGGVSIGYTGAKFIFTSADFPDSGSALWSAEMIGSSGSNIIDTPAIHYGSFVAINDPQGSWDSASALHDFQIIKPHVGHQVRLTDVTGSFVSGTFADDTMEFFNPTSAGILINIKTYHEQAHQWNLYLSGVLQQSGIQTHVADTWLYAEDIALSGVADLTYELRLYASGTSAIQHPNPLRTIEINIYILEGAGRFGIGRFGIARFGLESGSL